MENSPDIADLIHALKDDPELSSLLIKVLQQDKEQRIVSIQKLAREIERDGAPDSMVENILNLQNHSLADKVIEILNK